LRYRPLVCLALIHLLVDAYGQVVTPLWPRLQKDLGLDPWSLTALLAAWQLATSVSQPLFGYWGDRFGSRWMVGLGPALAVVCLSLIGFAPGLAGMTSLLVVGGLGIGAFHPEAAVGVAEESGRRATRGLAVFAFGGMVGLGLGPVVSGTLAEAYGLRSLAWTLLPGLLLLGLLVAGCRPALHAHPARGPGVRLAEVLDGRRLQTLLLLAVATLRIVPAIGVPLGLAFLLDRRDVSAAGIGRAQSLFLWSGSVGTLVCPLFARPGRELAALVGQTLLAAGCLLVLSAWDHPWAYRAGLVGSGFLLQGALPILLAYSQRLLPGSRRLAASLTLGASWGLGGIIVAALQAWFTAAGRPEGMLWAMVPFAAGASLGACLLPALAAGPGPALAAPASDLATEDGCVAPDVAG
jgi:FSR family fosmidomycin resistance protein-like MFS transporter